MHWWIPRPKPTWRFGVRPRSSSVGRSIAAGSRLAEPKTSQTKSPAAIRRPPSSVSAVAIRRIACCGASIRTTSSANAGIELGSLAKAALEPGVAGQAEHGVSDRARRRVVPGGDEHHHDPDEHVVVERRQLRVAADEAADDVVARVPAPLLDQRGHVRPELLADRDPLRAPGRALAADLVDPARPVVDQVPVVVGQREQQAERARRERMAEARREVGAARGQQLVDHLAREAPERLLERRHPLAGEVRVEHPPVDRVLGRVALERRAARVEERDDVAERAGRERRLDEQIVVEHGPEAAEDLVDPRHGAARPRLGVGRRPHREPRRARAAARPCWDPSRPSRPPRRREYQVP